MAKLSWPSVVAAALTICLSCLSATTVPSLFLPKVLRTVQLWQGHKQDFRCIDPKYTLRMVSYDPFIAHVENFFTDEESDELARLGLANARVSRVVAPDGDRQSLVDTTIRDSKTAFLNPRHPVVECVAHRAATMQGHLDRAGVRIQATMYAAGGYFNPHLDTGYYDGNNTTFKTADGLLHRVTTIFGALAVDCENCGTVFPRLSINTSAIDPRMCDFLECDTDRLTFKAVKNNAVFWRNRFNNGTVDQRLLHGGLPLARGFKHGLNIWTDIL